MPCLLIFRGVADSLYAIPADNHQTNVDGIRLVADIEQVGLSQAA